MTANVTIDVATVADVLRVPNAALRFRPETDDAEPAPTPAAAVAPGASGSRRGAAPRRPDRRRAGGGGGAGAGRRGPMAGAARQFGRTGGGGQTQAAADGLQTVYRPLRRRRRSEARRDPPGNHGRPLHAGRLGRTEAGRHGRRRTRRRRRRDASERGLRAWRRRRTGRRRPEILVAAARRHPDRGPRPGLPDGRGRGARPRRRLALDPARRVRRDHGPVGLGQEHVHEHRRLPRPADRRAATSSTASTSRASTATSAPRSATARSASSSSPSTCSRARRRSRTSSCPLIYSPDGHDREGPARRRRGSCLAIVGLGGPRGPPPEPALRRPAAARRDRARADQRPQAHPRRRADRQPRHEDLRGDHGRLPAPQRRRARRSSWSRTSTTSPSTPSASSCSATASVVDDQRRGERGVARSSRRRRRMLKFLTILKVGLKAIAPQQDALDADGARHHHRRRLRDRDDRGRARARRPRSRRRSRRSGTNFLMIFPGVATQSGARIFTGQSTITDDDVDGRAQRSARRRLRLARVALVRPGRRGNRQLGHAGPGRRRRVALRAVVERREGRLLRRLRRAGGGEGLPCSASTVANALFERQDPVGQMIRIKNFPFRVIGVLETKGGNTMGQDQDDIVIAPYTTVMRLLKQTTKIDMFMASAVLAAARSTRRRRRSRRSCASGTGSRRARTRTS